MGLCSGKLGGGGDCVDILETTAWIRGVVTGHQVKRKGQIIFQDPTEERKSVSYRIIKVLQVFI